MRLSHPTKNTCSGIKGMFEDPVDFRYHPDTCRLDWVFAGRVCWVCGEAGHPAEFENQTKAFG